MGSDSHNKPGYDTYLDKDTLHEKKYIHIGYTESKAHQIVLLPEFENVDKDSIRLIPTPEKGDAGNTRIIDNKLKPLAKLRRK